MKEHQLLQKSILSLVCMYVSILCCHALRYREASMEVMEVMSRFAVMERGSIDEAYLDLTSDVQERLQKLQNQPISADLLPTTCIEGFPQGPTTTEGTVEKGTSIASVLLLLPAFGTCFAWSHCSFLDSMKGNLTYNGNESQGLTWKDIQILLSLLLTY